MAKCYHNKGQFDKDKYLDAWKNLTSRCEHLYEIAKYYLENNDFESGYKYAKLGSTIKFPEDQTLFLDRDVYDWKILDELAISSYYIGKYEFKYML